MNKAAANESRATPWAVGILLALALFRCWYSTRLDLVPDEAYYWLWAQHLDWAYRDKGPLIAWTLSLTTHLFGDTVFGVRFLAVLLAAGTGWEIYRLARSLYGEAVALRSVLLAAIIPLYAIGAILTTIDSLSVYFWALACNLFLGALRTDRTRDWLAVGIAVGLGVLAKFTNGVQLLCFALFLLVTPDRRRLLVSPKLWSALGAFLVCCLPLLYWNMREGWLEFSAVQSRSGIDHTFHLSLAELWKYLVEESLALSPLFFIGMLVAGVGLLRERASFNARFLLTQFWPLVLLFLFSSLNRAGKANWIAPALVAGIVLSIVFWRGLAQKAKGWKILVVVGCALAFLETFLFHLAPYLPLKHDPAKRAKGWPDFAAHVEQARQARHPDYLIADYYSLGSEMAFYLPDHPTIYTPNGRRGQDQFTLWGAYAPQGKSALFVTDDPEVVPAILGAEFKDCVLVDDFDAKAGGHTVNHFRIYFLSNGKGADASP